jgi:hypothetical protein
MVLSGFFTLTDFGIFFLSPNEVGLKYSLAGSYLEKVETQGIHFSLFSFVKKFYAGNIQQEIKVTKYAKDGVLDIILMLLAD